MKYESQKQFYAGQTVVPSSSGEGEEIVGHIVERLINDFVLVLWLSSTRGAFTCSESIIDLIHCVTEAPGNYEPRYVSVSIAAVAD